MKDGSPIIVGERFRKLFILKIRVVIPKAANLCSTINNLQLWHERFRHENKQHVKEILSRQGIEVHVGENDFCEGCIFGKQARLKFEDSKNYAESTCELVHTDVNGPIEVRSIGGVRYFLLF